VGVRRSFRRRPFLNLPEGIGVIGLYNALALVDEMESLQDSTLHYWRPSPFRARATCGRVGRRRAGVIFK